MHSHFMNGDFGSNIYRLGTYVKNIRENNDKVILLDSGSVGLIGRIMLLSHPINVIL